MARMAMPHLVRRMNWCNANARASETTTIMIFWLVTNTPPRS